MSAKLKEKLITLLEEQFFTAADMQKFETVLTAKIREQGWFLQKNFAVTGLSDGRRGRVDYLVTTRSGARCAIEADNRSPRKRSLLKLSELPEGMTGFVLLKDGKQPLRYSVNGVDVVRATQFKY
ncbi:hypothetical protein ID858_17265 [Xenorhabdus sp. DI]|uniref:hypothetical protein n=1 Tax=Xenorhabdus doucetiae TaxID=351671 RepID=UPI00198C046F|nr:MULTISPECIES: hypothetical protein [unclassified Xenorhabdus]MBD2786433.1 hypothetical protein [Xenorhabdus sp. 3]MBD2790243.1 hypothetical protein [Xenorhabdus sp. DI]